MAYHHVLTTPAHGTVPAVALSAAEARMAGSLLHMILHGTVTCQVKKESLRSRWDSWFEPCAASVVKASPQGAVINCRDKEQTFTFNFSNRQWEAPDGSYLDMDIDEVEENLPAEFAPEADLPTEDLSAAPVKEVTILPSGVAVPAGTDTAVDDLTQRLKAVIVTSPAHNSTGTPGLLKATPYRMGAMASHKATVGGRVKSKRC